MVTQSRSQNSWTIHAQKGSIQSLRATLQDLKNQKMKRFQESFTYWETQGESKLAETLRTI